MALIPGWLPPTREHYNFLCNFFRYAAPFSLIQFLTKWYGMGKTSTSSRFNVPGKIGWFLMEIPGSIFAVYNASKLAAASSSSPSTLLSSSAPISSTGTLASLATLPLPNKLLLAMFLTHYLHRAVLAPLLLNPSMAPIHLFIWTAALAVQLLNGSSIGAWIGAYGHTTEAAWRGKEPQMIVGFALFVAGLLGNWWHDEELRKIRRDEIIRRKDEAKRLGKKPDLDKVYVLPERGLFKYILYPHYFAEWVEWTGYWMFCGWDCVPLQNFLFLEILGMLPRAWNGWYWYVEKFGREAVGSRKAVIPFLI